MQFTSDIKKQANEIVWDLSLNSIVLDKVQIHKHLGLIFEVNFNFVEHLKENAPKANKGIWLIKNHKTFTDNIRLNT